MKKTMSLALVLVLMLVLSCIAEVNAGKEDAPSDAGVILLRGDDVPALPARIVGLIGDIPANAMDWEEFARLDGLLKAWDAEAMIKDLRETGMHVFPDMGQAWTECNLDGQALSLESSGEQVTVSAEANKTFATLELGTDTGDDFLYLIADVDEASGELLKKHAVSFHAINDEEYGHFSYTVELGTDECELFVSAGQGSIAQNWQIMYDGAGVLKEKRYTEEDLSDAEF